ncbi:hypothetical protein Phi47:1_gp58 [Cellulophaga phage phi47:1]|nr:hypothetical protein Phi3ST:2_gp58 [Cellulophaga phage phi3ST:2]AGO48253.1 hypothetical protein PhiSM_gp58 [Cellulophaga phage phiSM]AGO49297.1 hypothetical protein Phi38:2_gp58 [Cellulophaga phage phi38:2]AGO49377.1 hypothetical protein Phi3:1_gp58 [Cellulophaga phage phi3:1]AGO49795.1 hypothetical protein Phi47:1_gp58 [Cellulophaga phage phi47:1]
MENINELNRFYEWLYIRCKNIHVITDEQFHRINIKLSE